MDDPALYEGLKKLPEGPVLKRLEAIEMLPQTPLSVAPEASAAEVLADLGKSAGADVIAAMDMVRVLSETLPRREAVWWTCLAGRDLLGREAELAPHICLGPAERWVFKPGEETREACFETLKTAKSSDDTDLCALAAVYSTGTMGPGDLEEAKVPEGMFANLVFGMIMVSMEAAPEDGELPWLRMQVERGLDIAKGGNGKDVALAMPEPEPEDDEDEETETA